MGLHDIAPTAILVVDNDRAVRTVVGTFLEHVGYTVLTANDGAEAINVFQQQQGRIALVLTEVAMPTMDGLHLADAILKLRPKLPVIFVSGNMHHADCGYGCIAKPFTLSAILSRVRQALALSQLRERHNAAAHG